MGYIGNQQTEGYSQVPPKQDLTGATGTTLTLSNAVASAEGIDLFINNVRQEPATAYSVGADGVTVTLTGSVVATDDIYVVYNSLARQTSTHPFNQALQATNGTFSGAVSAASATVTGNLTVDTDTLYVDSTNNRVGIGSSPAAKLHVQTSAVNSSIDNVADEFVIENNGASGMTILSANNDSGFILFGDNDSNAAGGIRYENPNDAFSFRTNSSWDRMRIDGNGNVALNGGVLDSSRFTINGNVSNPNLQSFQNTTSGVTHFWFRNPNGIVGSVVTSGSSTAYNTSSDYRLKENVTDITDATTRLKQLNPVRFNFIADADTTVDGFLAHEVQDVVPEAISGTHNEVDDDGNPVYQGIDQSKLVPLLVKTIQELEARIVALEAN